MCLFKNESQKCKQNINLYCNFATEQCWSVLRQWRLNPKEIKDQSVHFDQIRDQKGVLFDLRLFFCKKRTWTSLGAETPEVGGHMPPQVLGYQLTLFGPRGADYARHITTCPPIFSDVAASLRSDGNSRTFYWIWTLLIPKCFGLKLSIFKLLFLFSRTNIQHI